MIMIIILTIYIFKFLSISISMTMTITMTMINAEYFSYLKWKKLNPVHFTLPQYYLHLRTIYKR